MDKLISVILPVYNAGTYLSSAIESILNQTLKNFEFIIINDGSTDNSIEVIEYYANRDNRILSINRENKGLIYTLNEGIEKAQGKYIVRMDQDDISTENRLEVQYQYMLDNVLDICGGNYTEINAESKEIRYCKVFQNDYEILLTMASNVPFAHPSVMIKKDFLTSKGLRYGMNGYRHAEDLDMWMNMHNSGARFGNVNINILKYRILSTSMSRINNKKIIREVDTQFNKFIKKNQTKFEYAFDIFFKTEDYNQEVERIITKASLRYVLVIGKFSILFRCIKKVRIYNFLIGFLSFLKFKYNLLR